MEEGLAKITRNCPTLKDVFKKAQECELMIKVTNIPSSLFKVKEVREDYSIVYPFGEYSERLFILTHTGAVGYELI